MQLLPLHYWYGCVSTHHFVFLYFLKGFSDDSFSFLSLKGRMDAINVDKAVEFVLSCMNFDGGFGCRPGSESHAGQVRSQLTFDLMENIHAI